MLIKKKYNFVRLCFLIISVGLSSAAAQSKQTDAVFAAPSRLILKGDGREKQEERILIREKFFPIGWSKDGKFAYLVEPADEACGCYFARIVIQDLRTDKILWENNFDGDENVKDNLQRYWKKNQKEFSQKLKEHEIIAQKNFSIQNSVISYGKDRLTLELKFNADTSGGDLGIKGNVNLKLISKQKGRKTLYEYNFNPDTYERLLDAKLSGSLVSPFEARAAIIMIETRRGWEGPPDVTQIRIVGADLEKSFR